MPVQEYYNESSTCRLCKNDQLDLLMRLAPTPPANQFTPAPNIDQPSIPLDLIKCTTCNHVQLGQVVSPEILFSDYVYVSGTSKVFCKHFEDYSNSIVETEGLRASNFVVDIGSNDGTLLSFFKKRGMSVLGIDPAKKIAEEANSKGINTLNDFFNYNLAKEIVREHGRARVITANNAFAHIDNIGSVAEGIKHMLSPDGVFVFEVSYLLDVVQKRLFDTIYHEHLDYHSVFPLVRFFSGYGLRLCHVERVKTHGGSLRGFVCHADSERKTNESVHNFIEEEETEGIFKDKTYNNLSEEINDIGVHLREILMQAKKKGEQVVGFGAPAKATTLMHHLQIGRELIEYIVDDSPWKQGLYTPGLHVPVVDNSKLYKDKPEYIVVLAWNFADPIIKKHTELKKYGCKFVVPLPHLKII
ncbi:MAG: class I SAM-dependent methyltransferase [Oligoflexales bacterium]|nr:class I SAM-dependent methyltransferase [Oligoflexales bacterium]